MTATAATLRAHFPEFTNTVDYPTAQIDFWLSIAVQMLNAGRWGGMLDAGAELYACHHIVLEARDVVTVAAGGVPGQNTGPVSSKSVDRVSIGYDTGAASEERGGHWNLTTYGTRYLRFARMFGAGSLQVGVDGPIPPLSSSSAWGTPWYVAPNPSN